MGMDLKPIAPTNSAPKDEYGIVCGRYNWAGWSWLRTELSERGVDVTEFVNNNDGEVISADTCEKVADVIEAMLPELDEEYREWLAPHVIRWRTCGGYEQY